jgi:hypothetical protein
MVTGQAAGSAAAISAADYVTPREIDVGKLQRSLEEAGVFLRPEQADNRFEMPVIAP